MSERGATVEAVDAETLNTLLQHLDDFQPCPNSRSVAGLPIDGTVSPPGADPMAVSLVAESISQMVVEVEGGGLNKSNPAAALEDMPDYVLPDAQYVERTLLPLLLRGLQEVALVRPPDAVAFLGAYLIANNPQRPSAAFAAAATGGSSAAPSKMENCRAPGKEVPPTWPTSPADHTAPPAFAEVVNQAMQRFTSSKTRGGVAGAPVAGATVVAGAGGAVAEAVAALKHSKK